MCLRTFCEDKTGFMNLNIRLMLICKKYIYILYIAIDKDQMDSTRVLNGGTTYFL